MYVNDLAENINALGCGVDIDGEQLSLLLYADDVILIAPTENSLQRMLDTLNDWCHKWRLQINQDKTKVIHFRPSGKDRSNFEFKCGNKNLEITT